MKENKWKGIINEKKEGRLSKREKGDIIFILLIMRS
jgi:hypothetical protein